MYGKFYQAIVVLIQLSTDVLRTLDLISCDQQSEWQSFTTEPY